MPIDISTIDTGILLDRENAFYKANKKKWLRGMEAYGGGEEYIRKALVKHTNEIPPEYDERLDRAYYVNYPRRVATLITQYVLAVRPTREKANAEYVEDFSRTGLRVDEVMRQFSSYLNICGVAWLCVDSPAFEGEPTKADEQRERLRPYCVALSPLAVPDWHYGKDGKLDWVLTAETRIDNSNPFANEQEIEIRKLWLRDEVIIVEINKTTNKTAKKSVPNPVHEVPFIRYVEVDGYGIGENHWYEDVVRMSDAILNDNSEAQMNVLKQMFGLLVIPEDFLDNVNKKHEEDGNGSPAANGGGKKPEPLSFTLARSAAVFESKDGANVTRYIQPAGTETQVIRTEVDALKRELYSVVGLAASKDTKMVESAEAKEWDFQNVQAYMETRADILEQSEVKAWELLNKWDSNIPVPNVTYNRTFSLFNLAESVANLLNLSGFCQENDEYQREVQKTATALLAKMREIPAEIMSAIFKKIDESKPGTDEKEKKEMMRKMMNGTGGEGTEDGGQPPPAPENKGGGPGQIGFDK